MFEPSAREPRVLNPMPVIKIVSVGQNRTDDLRPINFNFEPVKLLVDSFCLFAVN